MTLSFAYFELAAAVAVDSGCAEKSIPIGRGMIPLSRPWRENCRFAFASSSFLLGAPAAAPSKKDDEANANLQFSRQGLDKGIIPRPIGMDFSAQPESTAKAAASSKYAKESVKGRLSERFTNNQRGKTKTTQAATLSIEGRGVDRV